MRDYDYLDVSQEGPEEDEFWIRFDNPGKKNAVNAQMHEELSYVFKDAWASDTRVVVITGKGGAFTTGGDAEWMPEYMADPEVFMRIIRQGEEILETLVNLEKPVIARVEGPCVSFGTTIALFSDIVVASENAIFGDVHPQMGLASGDGGAVIWPLLTNFNRAKEYLMTGRTFSAEKADELGLTNHVVPHEELDAKVDELIEELVSKPQYAVRYSKMVANTHLQMAMLLAGRQGLLLEGLTSQVPDHEIAAKAYMDDREPEFETTRDID